MKKHRNTKFLNHTHASCGDCDFFVEDGEKVSAKTLAIRHHKKYNHTVHIELSYQLTYEADENKEIL